MNDQEIFKLTDILSKTSIEKVCFEFYDAYCDVVNCTIKRLPVHTPSVQACSTSSDDALKKAMELLEKVKPWDKVIKIPSEDKKRYYPGYYREMLSNDVEIEFKNINNEFLITNIRRKDSDGYYYSEKPYPIENSFKFIKDLSDGTQLYEWDDIGILCGSAGDLIVKDGLVIKSRMTRIA